MKFLLGIILGLATVVSLGAGSVQAQTVGCCFNQASFCVDGLTQFACDSSYSTGSAGANFHSGQTCTQVSACSVTGRCTKTDGSNCSTKQKWQCDALYDQGFRFFQGEQCSAPASSTGTCCLQQPSAGGTIPTCEDNLDANTCQGQRLGQFYSTSCNTVAQCPQAYAGTASQVGTPAEPAKQSKVVFNPEIVLPFFSGGEVDGTTFARYLRAIFITFIWSVGVLATVMVIYGGVRWVSAAGDAGRINQAKDIVYNAIIGVVIGLTSVLLLNLIDPELVNFRGLSSLGTQQVQPIAFETDAVFGENNEAGPERPDPNNPGKTIGGCKTKSGRVIAQENVCVLGGTPFTWPVGNTTHQLTSRVGSRKTSVGSSCHPGADFSTGKVTGKPILAPVAGKITHVTPGLGEYIIRLEGNGFYLRLIHIKSPAVQAGITIQQGQLLGYSGGDPNDSAAIRQASGGPHLHLELYTTAGELHDPAPCFQP